MGKFSRALRRLLDSSKSDSGLVVAAWLPWVGAIAVVGVVGGTLGLAGVFGHPTSTQAVIASDASLTRTATAYACPGGPAIDALNAGDRVLAVQRSDDSSYLAVRDPRDLNRELWFRSADVTVDKSQAAIATLPVGSCPEINSLLMPPTNRSSKGGSTPSKPTTPTKPSAPDTSAPSLGSPSATHGSVSDPVCVNHPSDPSREYAIISASASDNKGVTGVSISWTGPGSDHGSGSMHKSGSVWKFTFDPVSTTDTGTATFSLQARDAAGNKSSIRTINLQLMGCVG
jgi:hypothetical protein